MQLRFAASVFGIAVVLAELPGVAARWGEDLALAAGARAPTGGSGGLGSTLL